MTTSSPNDSLSLSLTRDFKAPIKNVFQAWTDPDMLTKWFGPKGVDTVSARVDLTIGGRYEYQMKEPDGHIITMGGTYREIDPPNKLVFTWELDAQGCTGSDGVDAETIVTVEFQELPSATRIVLTHDLLPGENSKESHMMGWSGSLDCLEAVFST